MSDCSPDGRRTSGSGDAADRYAHAGYQLAGECRLSHMPPDRPLSTSLPSMPMSPMSQASTGPKCPICGKAAIERYRPFCSARCKDVDLHRWIAGVYAVPVTEDEEEDERRDGEAEPL